MKRFVMAIGLACALSGSALAGDNTLLARQRRKHQARW